MARGLSYEITAEKIPEVVEDLEGIAHRMTHARPAFMEVARILERGEQRHFARLGGKYVDTGATRASLTQPIANDAIRDAHHDELVFGSSVWYARFLRRRGKSAVLVLQPTERKAATQVIADFVMGRAS